MSYRNKIYICFGGDEDMHYYRTLQMWNANKSIDFQFGNAHDLTNIRILEEPNIKRNLRERLKNSKTMLVIVGEKTKYLYKYVRWEMELALELDIPIIVANLNGKNKMDDKLCPPILKGKTVVHVPFNLKAVMYALEYWENYYPQAKTKQEHDLYWNHL